MDIPLPGMRMEITAVVFVLTVLLSAGVGGIQNKEGCHLSLTLAATESFGNQTDLSNSTSNGNQTDCHTAAPVAFLLTVLRRLDWQDVILVSAGEDGEEFWGGTDRLLMSLFRDFRKVSVLHSSIAWQPRGLPALIQLGPKGATQSLDIVVVCHVACVTSVLNGAREFERRWKSQTALRERSKWLVYVTDVCHPTRLDLSNVTMNNVATVVPEVHSGACLRLTERHRCCLPSGAASVKTFSLHTLMWTKQGRQLSLVHRDVENGSTSSASFIFPNLQLGFNGKLLRIGMNPYSRFTIHTLKSGATVYGGLDMEILKFFSENLNFTYEILLPEDRMWGDSQGNGSWSGLIGMLQRREVDAVAIPFLHTLSRSEVVDFTSTLEFDPTAMLYRQVPPRTYGLVTYLKPFRLEVFGCILLAVLLTALFLSALDFSSNVPGGPEEVIDGTSLPSSGLDRLRTWLGHFLLLLKSTFWALFHKGDQGEAKSMSGRVLQSFWWLFSLAITAAYTGNLVAFLTVPQDGFTISTFEDLLSQTEYKWGTINSSGLHVLLKESNLSVQRRVWQGIQRFAQEDPGVLAVDDRIYIRKVLQEKFILIATVALMQRELFEHCELSVKTKGLGTGKSSPMIQKNSAYEPMFSQKLQALLESGLWSAMESKWRRQHQNLTCAASSFATQERPAALADVQAALYVLLAGAATALAVLVCELLTNFFLRKEAEQASADKQP